MSSSRMISGGESTNVLPVMCIMTTLLKPLHRAAADRVGTRNEIDPGNEPHRLTQEQFALRYGLDVDAVQNWEQGRYQPDRATLAYLRVIERQPTEAARAQEEPAV